MVNWIWVFLVVAGGLFAVKLAYVLSVALVLPYTRGALYVSSSGVRVNAFVEAVPMKAGQLLVDLGCGDGRVLRRAWRRYGVRAIGYEVNPLACLRARLRCLGLTGVKVRWRNFWTTDLSQADVVFCYLFPDVMALLADKIRAELKPGAVIVSCNFALPGFTPHQVLRPGNQLHNDPIYVYRLGEPADVHNADRQEPHR